MRAQGWEAILALASLGWGAALGAVAPPGSLKTVPIPRPTKQAIVGKSRGGTHDLADFIPPDKEAAAIRLGKALFWDLQVGSEGTVACASCHFHAGTDSRTTNTLNPGPNAAFDVVPRPNRTLTRDAYPFRKLVNPEFRPGDPLNLGRSFEISDADDVAGSQGVPFTRFLGVVSGNAADLGRPVPDHKFQVDRRNVHRVTGRNTPTVINAVFNFANFWDGRANHFFNGVNPFGPQDANARVWDNAGGTLAPVRVLLSNSSLASQAVGPPGSDVEMSWAGRTFPDIGKKMLSLAPLAKQIVHPGDSVLGSIAKSNISGDPKAKGLAASYVDMLQAAFDPRWWGNTSQHLTRNSDGSFSTADGPANPADPKQFSQAEVNFSLFFGLAVQMYESTLVSDDTPFDRFITGDTTALTPRQQEGFLTFQGIDTNCTFCHSGPEFTAVSVGNLLNPAEAGLIEVMPMGDLQNANYDIGFYNIGVRPTANDLGRGGSDPFGNPLAFARQAVIVAGLAPGPLTFDTAFVPSAKCLPDPFGVPVPRVCPPTTLPRVAVDGAFKVPDLRNVELTGPYFHHGGMATLRQVVDFYTRGGDFHEANIDNLDPVIQNINSLKSSLLTPVDQARAAKKAGLIDFLLSLTDERVRQEAAPFDHPQLFVEDGHTNEPGGNPKRHGGMPLADRVIEIPAVGAAGRAAQGLEPLRPFLWDGTPDFHFKP